MFQKGHMFYCCKYVIRYSKFNSRVLIVGFCVVLFITVILSLHIDSLKKQGTTRIIRAASKVGSNKLHERYKQALNEHDVKPEKQEMKLEGNNGKIFNDSENYNFMLKLLKLQTSTTKSIKDEIIQIHNKVKFNKWGYGSQRKKRKDKRELMKNDNNMVINCVTERELFEFIPSRTKSLTLDGFEKSYKESSQSRMHSFKYVFNSRAWGHSWDSNYKGLNASGRGATLDWAQETIATLHTTVNKIKMVLNQTEVSLLDIPCGDMAWMSRFLKTRDDIRYTGIDIVPELIKHHQQMFKSQSKWTFYNFDALSSSTKIEQYDIILCRTLLQHLYNYDVMKLLMKFSESESKFLLLTTFPSLEENRELVIDIDNAGRFRRLNLQLPPFSLSQPLCMSRDGPPDIQEGLEHVIGLWRLPLKQIEDCQQPDITKPNGIPLKFYSCGVS